MKRELIAQTDPKSPISEIFRTLRTNIQFMTSSKKLQVIQVTSTFPGEGKSYVSSNLAVTFAQAGKKVIIIDADMRKGSLYNIFDVSPRPGLSNYLSGIDEEDQEEIDLSKYIQQTEVENLLIMTAGNIPPNPSELLVSPQMNKLLEDLKEVCDIIIIDGTPCQLVTDSIILSRIVDTTVIVTAYKQTKKDTLGRIIRNIQNVGGKIAGVVINKMPITAKKYSETYYYGSTTMNSIPKSKNRVRMGNSKNAEQLRNRATSTLKNDTRKIINNTNNNKNQTMERPNYRNSTTRNVSKNQNNNNPTRVLNDINKYLEEEKKNLN